MECRGQVQVEAIGQKTIWTFWDKGESKMPAWNKLNLRLWKRQEEQGWQVRVLNEVPGDPHFLFSWLKHCHLPERYGELSAQARADAVRAALMYIYGGIWMDSSVIPLQSLDKLCWSELEQGDVEYCGFYMPRTELVGEYEKDFLENWFMASKPGRYLTGEWYSRFKMYHDQFADGKGLREFENTKDVEHDVLYGGYLTMHAAMLGLLKTDQFARNIYEHHTRLHHAFGAFTFMFAKPEWILDQDWVRVRFLESKDDAWLDELLHSGTVFKFNGGMAEVFKYATRDHLLDTKHNLGRMYELLFEKPFGD
jgi:hypothetical protein